MDWLFLKALVVMIVRHLHTTNELLSGLAFCSSPTDA
jgi:hypothetical protein